MCTKNFLVPLLWELERYSLQDTAYLPRICAGPWKRYWTA